MRWCGRPENNAERRSGSAWLLIALSALSLPLVTGCAEESRQEVMQAFQLDLPPCQTEKETFSGQTSWPGPSLVLSFKAPKDCVNQYLKDHEADVTNPIQWPGSAESTMGDVKLSPTRPPFEDASMKQFHLELDPGKKYEIFTGFRTPKEAEFRVLLVPDGDDVTAYMESTTTGDVGKKG